MLAKLKEISTTVWNDIKDTYSRFKIVIYGILLAIVYLEWNRIKVALLMAGGKKELTSAKKEDAALTQIEKTDSQQADALVKKAQNEPSQPDDWYIK